MQTYQRPISLFLCALKHEAEPVAHHLKMNELSKSPWVYFCPKRSMYLGVIGIGSTYIAKRVQSVLDIIKTHLQAQNTSLPENHAMPRFEIINFGLCGALNPTLARGDVIAIQKCFRNSTQENPLLINTSTQNGCDTLIKGDLLTSDDILATPQQKMKAFETTQVDAVDMEGYALIQHCREQDLPCSIYKCVFDTAHDDLTCFESACSNLIANPRLFSSLPIQNIIKDSLLQFLTIIDKLTS